MEVIVFSKDRACQLDMLLRSIDCFAGDLYSKVHVIYCWTGKEYEDGYGLLKERVDRVIWHDESGKGFDTVLRSCLESVESEHVGFLVDDAFFFQAVEREDVRRAFDEANADIFSVRLGKNIIVQDLYSSHYLIDIPQFDASVEGVLFWEWNSLRPYTDFAYPASLDGNVFRTEIVVERLRQLPFLMNPNVFEAWLAGAPQILGSRMACLPHSALITCPINRVQDTYDNPAGRFYGKTVEDLNRMFLQGYGLSYESGPLQFVVSCKQELPTRMVPYHLLLEYGCADYQKD